MNIVTRTHSASQWDGGFAASRRHGEIGGFLKRALRDFIPGTLVLCMGK